MFNEYASGTDQFGVRFQSGPNHEIFDDINDGNNQSVEGTTAINTWKMGAVTLGFGRFRGPGAV